MQQVVKDEVNKLLKARLIREVGYLMLHWLRSLMASNGYVLILLTLIKLVLRTIILAYNKSIGGFNSRICCVFISRCNFGMSSNQDGPR